MHIHVRKNQKKKKKERRHTRTHKHHNSILFTCIIIITCIEYHNAHKKESEERKKTYVNTQAPQHHMYVIYMYTSVKNERRHKHTSTPTAYVCTCIPQWGSKRSLVLLPFSPTPFLSPAAEWNSSVPPTSLPLHSQTEKYVYNIYVYTLISVTKVNCTFDFESLLC